MDFVVNMMDFVVNMMYFVVKMMNLHGNGQVADTMGCNAASGFTTEEQQIACLVSKDAADLAAAGGGVGLPCRDGCGWAPVVDGAEIPDWPMSLIQSGHRATDKPIIQSHCYDDGAGFTYMQATGDLKEVSFQWKNPDFVSSES